MNNGTLLKVIITILYSTLINLGLAQTFTAGDMITLQVNDYSLIETNHAPISLVLGSSTPGAPINSASNSDMFLRLSSLVPGGTDREVTTRISSGSIPSGTTLTVLAAPCTITNSGGALGQVNPNPITLTSTDQLLVSFIGSCYTGTGNNDGYQLTFDWAPTNLGADYQYIEATTTPVNITIVFTITAHDGN